MWPGFYRGSIDVWEPPDVLEAHDEWQANCGPCSLACLMREPVDCVRHLFPRYPARPWTNPTHMIAAIDAAGLTYHKAATVKRKGHEERKAIVPDFGLVFLQWSGPWDNASIEQRYRHTHWVAVDGEMLWDLNFGWLDKPTWNSDGLRTYRRSLGITGAWPRAALVLLRREMIDRSLDREYRELTAS